MLWLQKITCPKCDQMFSVEADDGGLLGGRVCRCPKCFAEVPVRAEDGVPQSESTPWAILATAVEQPADPG